jgi:hypothetical protein
LRVRDGQRLSQTASSRMTVGYHALRDAIVEANRAGDLYVMGDNLSSHQSPPIQEWLAAHSRVHPVFIPQGVSWLNLQEPWGDSCAATRSPVRASPAGPRLSKSPSSPRSISTGAPHRESGAGVRPPPR